MGRKPEGKRRTGKARKRRVADRLKALGYSGVDDFFLRNAGRSFRGMARLLGLSLGGIQYHYRRWYAKQRRLLGGCGGRKRKQ